MEEGQSTSLRLSHRPGGTRVHVEGLLPQERRCPSRAALTQPSEAGGVQAGGQSSPPPRKRDARKNMLFFRDCF